MGKITMNGKDITSPFPYNGKQVVKLTVNGKDITLLKAFVSNPHLSVSSSVLDGIELAANHRNTWFTLSEQAAHSAMVSGGGWTHENSWPRNFGNGGSDDYSTWINAGRTLHVYTSHAGGSNHSYSIDLTPFKVNDYQEHHDEFYIRQHNGAIQLYITTGGRWKITRWDIT